MNSLQTYEPKCKDILGIYEAKKEKEHRIQMRKELKEEIIRIDNEMFKRASRKCPLCGDIMHSHGHSNPRTYLAACGEVSIRLHRLRCTSCGHISVPGAEIIPQDGISACLGEKMCDLAAKIPYAKATESLFIQHGIHMSTKRYWTFVQKESDMIEDALANEAVELYEDGIVPESINLKEESPLIIGIDGGHVRGWKSNPSFEVKCATVATGSTQISDKNKRRKLTNRVGYAAECSVEDFRKRISTLAIKSGYLTASARIFVSDGAAWITKMIADWFPDAIHVLDMYHLKNKVQTLFGIRAEGELAEIRDEALMVCDTYDPDSLISVIASWQPDDNDKIADRDDLIFYIKNNSDAIKNHRLIYIHGSGWIEKGVDLMISRRLKNRGMSWTVKGCSHMIPFAVLRYNQQWSVYWNKRKGFNLVNIA